MWHPKLNWTFYLQIYYLFSSVNQKSETGLTRLKPWCWQGWIPSWTPSGQICFFAFSGIGDNTVSFFGGKPVTLMPAWSNQIFKGKNVNGELNITLFFFYPFLIFCLFLYHLIAIIYIPNCSLSNDTFVQKIIFFFLY